ncbi:10756_t:CDS:2 [Funneliformis caledonium]|uniref:10756_t:CDS:1 n=1 Tax=Funneliformis caledonium TaxID=1117310 RepID=A0A9N8VBE6_9GLOM|nr:10756_t:CDS:2 [Funneliformis caledonium]
MDETPVYFDIVGNLIIENCGAKTVQIQTTGNEKNWFTYVLTVLQMVQNYYQLSFLKVWRKRPGGNRINKQRSLLVMDSFEGHK